MTSFIVYATFRFLFWLYFTVFHNLKVSGRENVPKRGAFLAASNHASYLDPILIGASTHRFLKYLARDTLFKGRFSRWAMRNVRAIPLKKGASDFGAIRQAIDILKKGCPLVIFPEGTRSVDGELKDGARGVGFLVAKAGVPVIPVYVGGSYKAMPKFSNRLTFHPLRVYFGRAVYFGDLFEDRSKFGYDKISQEIMRCIGQLKTRYESEISG